MILLPYTHSRPDRYCRLLPPYKYLDDAGDLAVRLRALAASMHQPRAARGTRRGERRPTDRELIPAAYTYFGQFIMHDLTSDDTPLRSAGLREPEEIINYRSPRLDLDSL